MSAFYESHPPVSGENHPKFKLFKFSILGSPLVYVVMLLVLYYQLPKLMAEEGVKVAGYQLSQFEFIAFLFGIITLITWIAGPLFLMPLVEKSLQKEVYLRKYGTPGVAICRYVPEKQKSPILRALIPKIELEINGDRISYIFGTQKGMSNGTDERFRRMKEGETVQIVYNPQDKKDYLLT